MVTFALFRGAVWGFPVRPIFSSLQAFGDVFPLNDPQTPVCSLMMLMGRRGGQHVLQYVVGGSCYRAAACGARPHPTSRGYPSLFLSTLASCGAGCWLGGSPPLLKPPQGSDAPRQALLVSWLLSLQPWGSSNFPSSSASPPHPPFDWFCCLRTPRDPSALGDMQLFHSGPQNMGTLSSSQCRPLPEKPLAPTSMAPDYGTLVSSDGGPRGSKGTRGPRRPGEGTCTV